VTVYALKNKWFAAGTIALLLSSGLEFAQPRNGGHLDTALFVTSCACGIFALFAYFRSTRGK
jgi:hypothetical protein